MFADLDRDCPSTNRKHRVRHHVANLWSRDRPTPDSMVVDVYLESACAGRMPIPRCCGCAAQLATFMFEPCESRGRGRRGPEKRGGKHTHQDRLCDKRELGERGAGMETGPSGGNHGGDPTDNCRASGEQLGSLRPASHVHPWLYNRQGRSRLIKGCGHLVTTCLNRCAEKWMGREPRDTPEWRDGPKAVRGKRGSADKSCNVHWCSTSVPMLISNVTLRMRHTLAHRACHAVHVAQH